LAFHFEQTLFHNQKEVSETGEAYLYAVANRLGVDVEQMKIDMNGEVVARMILDDQEIATAHGLKGTPSFIIGSETVTAGVSVHGV